MAKRRLEARIEKWPIRGKFTISRGSRTEAMVVVARITEDGATGRGECVPYARYDETPEGVLDAVMGLEAEIGDGLTREALQAALPSGAARNALDCAFWDLEAKSAGQPVAELVGLSNAQRPLITAFTLSLDTPDRMAEAAVKATGRPLLKVKLGGDGDADRIARIREARPDARLIVDANEAWRPEALAPLMAACLTAGVELVEQPLPAQDDAALADIARSVPVCADESLHDLADLDRIAERYDAINIKLDKTGGLTEAWALAEEALRRDLKLMVGCMIGTSLSMAPAFLVAQRAEVVDLDAPLFLEKDRDEGLTYRGSEVQPPVPDLWG